MQSDSWAGIRKDLVGECWPHVFDLIAKACSGSYGRLTPGAVLSDLKSGDMQLWVTHDGGRIAACFVTTIIDYPLKRYCRILIATGRGRQRWQHFMPVLESWARQQGCAGMESIARKGWTRVLAVFGWRQTHVFLEKTFSDEVTIH